MLHKVSKKHNKWLKLAKNLCNNKTDAEDIVQDMYLKLLNINKELNDAYICRIITNMVYDKTRSNRKTVSVDSNILANIIESNNTVQEETKHIDYKLLYKGLSEIQKEIIQLRCVDGYCYESISDKLNMKEVTIRVALSRARKKMKDNRDKINNTND